ncbi:MAG: type 1 glutamine amidotransferase, partial [Aquificaceae bacterium]
RGDKGKEIGWFKVFKSGTHNYFENFPEEVLVFQWHGDTFELPKNAIRVYSSEKYENQAFVYEKVVGLQFHIEVTKGMVAEWTMTYKKELNKEGLNPKDLLNIDGKHTYFLRGLINKLISRLVH